MATKKKAPAASKAKPPSNAEPQLSRFQAFETRRMHRRDLKGAPYNPRILTDEARKNLKRNLDSDNGGVGLLGPVTWNETTGFIVGGHQRLAVLDALEGSDNYLIDVAVVRLTVKQEKEQNIALNNDRLAANWDLDLLADLLKTPDLELEATGFTVMDLNLTFEDPELGTLFTPNTASKALLDDLQALQDDGKAPPKVKREIMKETRARNEEAFVDDDTEIYATVAFMSREEREAFMTHCGVGSNERYIDGSKVLAKMGEQIAAAVRAARPKPPPPPEKPAKPAKKANGAKKSVATSKP